MAKNSKTTSSGTDPIEQDFIAALGRLSEGEPTNKQLKLRKSRGTLKINISTVALEAGHSRTLIALADRSRYPLVRELIERSQVTERPPPTTLSEVNSRQRAENIEVKAQLNLYKALVLTHFKARETAEKQANYEREISSRLRKEIAAKNKVAKLSEDKS